MAMSYHKPARPDGPSDPPRDARMGAAIRSNRARTDARWVEISDRVRTRALRVTRRSLPVIAQAPSGPINVSEQVLITYVRDALDGVSGARVEEITIAVDVDNTYSGITIFLSARFGEPLLPVADAVRDLAAARLRELLGDITPPVTVATMEVHFDDVDDDA